MRRRTPRGDGVTIFPGRSARKQKRSSGCRSPSAPRKEAPHSALTGADAARADVTGRCRRGAETLVVATALSVIFLYALLAVGGAWG